MINNIDLFSTDKAREELVSKMRDRETILEAFLNSMTYRGANCTAIDCLLEIEDNEYTHPNIPKCVLELSQTDCKAKLKVSYDIMENDNSYIAYSVIHWGNNIYTGIDKRDLSLVTFIISPNEGVYFLNNNLESPGKNFFIGFSEKHKSEAYQILMSAYFLAYLCTNPLIAKIALSNLPVVDRFFSQLDIEVDDALCVLKYFKSVKGYKLDISEIDEFMKNNKNVISDCMNYNNPTTGFDVYSSKMHDYANIYSKFIEEHYTL